MITTWRGRDIKELSRDELLEALEFALRALDSERRQFRTYLDVRRQSLKAASEFGDETERARA